MSETLETVHFLSMNGRATEAIDLYKDVFSADVLMRVTYEQLAKMDPMMNISEQQRSLITHSVLRIGKSKLMIAEDTMTPYNQYKVGNNTSICVQSANKEEITEMYNRLTAYENSKVIEHLAPNVFSEAYGVVEDPFGVHWQLMFDNRLR